jgi:prepilin-type N-terminal cleavage/methylation domain-containing protein
MSSSCRFYQFHSMIEEIYLYKIANKRTRKGYSLNELIIVIAIFSILSGLLIKGALNYKTYSNKIDVDYCNNSIMKFINSAKAYCRNKEKSGYIYFDSPNGIIYFLTGEVLEDKYALPAGFRLNDVNLGIGKYAIEIDARGFTNNACTISYVDRKRSMHRITMCVGTSYVEIKD